MYYAILAGTPAEAVPGRLRDTAFSDARAPDDAPLRASVEPPA